MISQRAIITTNPSNKFNLLHNTDTPDIEYGDSDYAFSLLGEKEFDVVEHTEIYEEDDKEPERVDFKQCPDCKIPMGLMKTSYRCLQCGRDKKVILQTGAYSTSIIDNYNTNASCSLSMKIVGKDSYKYYKALLRTSSDYSKVQNNNTNKQLSRFNARRRSGGKLPRSILTEAADLYSKIQSHNIVRRGNGRKGVLGACISFVCNIHNITKKPKEIASFLNIEESYLSNGDKLLRSLHSQGKIDIPVNHDPTESYIYQYFQAFNIDQKYKPFVLQLIEASKSPTLMMGENNSRISTKCAGAVHVLNTQEKLGISKDDIVARCKIVRSTFTRYYEFLIINRKGLKPIFVEHGIPPLKKLKKGKKSKRVKRAAKMSPPPTASV
jgi:transcription initiation factor TFIIIB Brf1 subunit/transcription initiation factor TFIIB